MEKIRYTPRGVCSREIEITSPTTERLLKK